MENRTYESVYPCVGTVTVTLIKEIKEMGAYSFLSEYGNTLGMLMMSELSRRRIRSINKFIKTGKTEVVVVVRADSNKGYIDLSKRRIAEGETFCMEKKWNYGRLINSIVNHVSNSTFINNEDSRIRWLWPFYRNFGHAIIAFKKISQNWDDLHRTLNYSSNERLRILNISKKKLPIHFKKIASNFEINCFSAGGVTLIKNIIREAISVNIKNHVTVKLVAGPLYSITIVDNNKKNALKTLFEIYSSISAKIVKKKGYLLIKNFFFM